MSNSKLFIYFLVTNRRERPQSANNKSGNKSKIQQQFFYTDGKRDTGLTFYFNLFVKNLIKIISGKLYYSTGTYFRIFFATYVLHL